MQSMYILHTFSTSHIYGIFMHYPVYVNIQFIYVNIQLLLFTVGGPKTFHPHGWIKNAKHYAIHEDGQKKKKNSELITILFLARFFEKE